ncbi:MAG: hypothetical protein Q9219_004054 [cf. Caloplaca sp. 3 TL-2023]
MATPPPPPPPAPPNNNTTTATDALISHASALAYWTSIPPTVNGMLGGFPHISRTDIRGSLAFVEKLRRLHPTTPSPPSTTSTISTPTTITRAVDCGAGIGRVTAGVLSTICDVIDIVEPVEKFAREAVQQGGGKGKIGEVYVTGLQDWVPPSSSSSGYYDIIWNQWCLGHLRDEELVGYFKRCSRAVRKEEAGGWIIVKENMSTDVEGADIYDEVDSSVTRTDEKFRRLFAEAGLVVVRTEVQGGFPKKLFPVRFYALRLG